MTTLADDAGDQGDRPPGHVEAGTGAQGPPWLGSRNRAVARPTQVQAMDVACIPASRGFVCRAAVVERFSRDVPARRLSITLSADVRLEALQEAPGRHERPDTDGQTRTARHGRPDTDGQTRTARHGRPDTDGQTRTARHGRPGLLNTPQGSQLISIEFIKAPRAAEIAVSLDGQGAWRDTALIERPWRTVRYEEVHPRANETVSKARASLGRPLGCHNATSPQRHNPTRPPSHLPPLAGKRLVRPPSVP